MIEATPQLIREAKQRHDLQLLDRETIVPPCIGYEHPEPHNGEGNHDAE